MQELKQYQNPRLNEAIGDLFALAFHSAGRKMHAQNSGLADIAGDHAFSEAVIHKIVAGLAALDKELSAGMQEEEVPPCR